MVPRCRCFKASSRIAWFPKFLFYCLKAERRFPASIESSEALEDIVQSEGRGQLRVWYLETGHSSRPKFCQPMSTFILEATFSVPLHMI